MFEEIFDLVETEEKITAQAQLMVEGSVQLPEETTVITALAKPVVSGCEIINGEATVTGNVLFHLLCETDETVCLNTSVPFSQSMKLGTARGRSVGSATVTLFDIQAENIGGEVRLSALAEIHAEGVQRSEVKCVKDISGPGVQMQSAEIETALTLGSGSGRTTVETEIDLARMRYPQAKRILLSSAEVEVTDSYCSQDRVMVAGEVVMKLLIACEDEYEPFMELEERIDFTQAVDAAGADPDCMCRVDARAEEVFTELRGATEEQGETVSCQIVIHTQVRASKTESHLVLTDLYSTEVEVKCGYSELVMSKGAKMNAHASLKLPAPVSEGMPPIAKVLYCEAQPVVVDIQPHDGRIEVDGMMDGLICYRGAGAGLCAYRMEMPFSCVLDAPEANQASQCHVLPKVMQKSAVITAADEAELRVSMDFDITAVNSKQTRVLTEVEAGEPHGAKSAICLYTVQEGDTLWSVAKRLCVTQADLMEFNPDLNEELIPGTKILAYRQIKVS